MPNLTLRRLVSALAAVLGLGFTPAAAGEISADQAPADWVAYAEGATQAITGWLNDPAPPAPRVRARLQVAQPDPDQPVPPLVVKVWTGHDGAITHVEFASLGDVQADADLRALLIGRRLSPPPKHMRLPMRIALELKPDHRAPPPAPPQSGGV
jgi:hypothetical protein